MTKLSIDAREVEIAASMYQRRFSPVVFDLSLEDSAQIVSMRRCLGGGDEDGEGQREQERNTSGTAE